MLKTLVLFLFSTCWMEFVKADLSGSPLLTEETYPDAIKEKPHFIKFFAPWCAHCTKLAPVWEELYESFAADVDVGIARVDCTQQPSLCAARSITGYPTLLYVRTDGSAERYKGSRSLSELMLYVNSLAADAEKEVPSAVEHTEALFSTSIATGHHFVKFYAPWCGHCKVLAPIWDKLSEAFSADRNVIVGKVDCTQHESVCEQHAIKGYPTLLWFTDGVQVGDKYSGERSLDALRSFAEQRLAEGKPAAVINAEADDGTTLTPPKPLSSVTVLTKDNFSEAIGRASVSTFVKFFAPWCGHCKKMATAYSLLATRLAGQAGTDVAEVDCAQEKQLCADQQVDGFPTLLLYREGTVVAQYSGDRSTEHMLDFLMGHFQKDEL